MGGMPEDERGRNRLRPAPKELPDRRHRLLPHRTCRPVEWVLPRRRSVEFLGQPDDKILWCPLNHLLGHCQQDVDFENPFDLRQESIQ